MPKINVNNLIVIVIIGFVLIYSNTGGLYIYGLDEAENTSCAREMTETEECLMPTFNYELRTEKPA